MIRLGLIAVLALVAVAGILVLSGCAFDGSWEDPEAQRIRAEGEAEARRIRAEAEAHEKRAMVWEAQRNASHERTMEMLPYIVLMFLLCAIVGGLGIVGWDMLKNGRRLTGQAPQRQLPPQQINIFLVDDGQRGRLPALIERVAGGELLVYDENGRVHRGR